MATILPGDVGEADTYPTAYIQDLLSTLDVAQRQEFVRCLETTDVFGNADLGLHIEEARISLGGPAGSHCLPPCFSSL
jgi:hypothetical protein